MPAPKVSVIPQRLMFAVHRVAEFAGGRVDLTGILAEPTPLVDSAEFTLSVRASGPLHFRAGQTLEVTVVAAEKTRAVPR
jgi:hypothetical protein